MKRTELPIKINALKMMAADMFDELKTCCEGRAKMHDSNKKNAAFDKLLKAESLVVELKMYLGGAYDIIVDELSQIGVNESE